MYIKDLKEKIKQYEKEELEKDEFFNTGTIGVLKSVYKKETPTEIKATKKV